MKKRPWVLTLLPFLLVGVVISFPLQIMYFYNQGLDEWSSIFEKLSYLNLIVMVLCLVDAFLIYRVSKKAVYVTPIMIIAMAINNWWVGKIGSDYGMMNTSFATFAFIAMNALLLLSEAHRALLKPKQQWWRSAPRSKIEMPIVISPWVEGVSFSSETFDLSESGAYICEASTPSHLPRNSLQQPQLKPDDFIEIRFQVAGFYQIRCSAKVVRVQNEKTSYPPGIGIQFTEMDAKDQKILRRFLKGEMSV